MRFATKEARNQALFEHYQRFPKDYSSVLATNISQEDFNTLCEQNPAWLAPVRLEAFGKIKEHWAAARCLSLQIHCKVGHGEKYQDLINTLGKEFNEETGKWDRVELFYPGSGLLIPLLPSKGTVDGFREEIHAKNPIMQDESGKAAWLDLAKLVDEAISAERAHGFLQNRKDKAEDTAWMHWAGDAAGYMRGLKVSKCGFSLKSPDQLVAQNPRHIRTVIQFEAHRPLQVGPDSKCPYCPQTFPDQETIDALPAPQSKNQIRAHALTHYGVRFGTPPLFKFPLALVYLYILHMLLRLASITFQRTIEVNLNTKEKVEAINRLIKHLGLGCKKVEVRKTNASRGKDTEPINFIGSVERSTKAEHVQDVAVAYVDAFTAAVGLPFCTLYMHLAMGHIPRMVRDTPLDIAAISQQGFEALLKQGHQDQVNFGNHQLRSDRMDKGRNYQLVAKERERRELQNVLARPISRNEKRQLGGVSAAARAAKAVVDRAARRGHLSVASRSKGQLEKRLEKLEEGAQAIVDQFRLGGPG
ncbi:hypothetical protein KFL_012380020 [Klebsormidium nitens]|uniref:Uncharacterized protein n=1 Tax=Klebsormidium nitens TaxID=105231 RepID=A0A1Y1ISH0_KLENI|nr:hypothetical protein KFL_012380020 [Klebsormidium nitens]|eukprot:GAQ92992.1 hypothetical protein KFL_012380020 [Klebsormidium nitens]